MPDAHAPLDRRIGDNLRRNDLTVTAEGVARYETRGTAVDQARRDSLGAVNWRGTVFQDVDVID